MEKKKTYIAPNLTIVKIDTQNILAGSGDTPKPTDFTFDLANKWNEQGDVEQDGDLAISAKHHTAWDTWDE